MVNPVKNLAITITITKNHLNRVPESIVVIFTKMYRGSQRHSRIIYRISIKNLIKKSNVAPSPSYASSAAISPVGPWPLERTSVPGKFIVVKMAALE